MADQAIYSPMRVLDENGDPVPGALVTFYATGTTTLIDVYQDAAATILSTNPVVADADGNLPQRWVSEPAKVVVTDASAATIRTIDPVPVSPAGGSGAAQVSFSPTADIPVATVQLAIELVDTNSRERDEALTTGKQAADDTLTSLSGLSLVQGDILYATAADTLARLPKGTAGQTLAMNAGATAPEWISRGQVVAWVNFNGTGTPAIRASHNVASITDNGTGDYTINFTTPIADANYAIIATAGNSAAPGDAIIAMQGGAAPTTSAARVGIHRIGTGPFDPDYVFVQIVR